MGGIVNSTSHGNQLGFIDPVTAFAAIKNVFSFFGKDPSKAEYDRITQQVGEKFTAMINEVDRDVRPSGALTRSVLQQYIDEMVTLRKEWAAFTDKFRSKIEASWIEPRYQGLDDFMEHVVNLWRTELNTLPADYFSFIPGMSPTINMPQSPAEIVAKQQQMAQASMFGGGMSSILIMGLVGGAIYMLTKKMR
jgi:hypothetical protein